MVRKKLEFGDYTIRGMESCVRVERKGSLRELAANMVGRARARYASIYRSMAGMRWKALVVESDLTELGHPMLQGERGEAVLRYLTRINTEYGVPVHFLRSPTLACRWTRAWFEMIWSLRTTGHTGLRAVGRQMVGAPS